MSDHPALQLTSPYWATLPPELVRGILTHGARSSTQFCLNLSLTASWTRQLACKELYHTLVVSRSTFNRIAVGDQQHRLKRKDSGDYQSHTTALEVLPLIRGCWLHDSDPANVMQSQFEAMSSLEGLVGFAEAMYIAVPREPNWVNDWLESTLDEILTRDGWENLRFAHVLRCTNLVHVSLSSTEFACLIMLGVALNIALLVSDGLLAFKSNLQLTLQAPFNPPVNLHFLYNKTTANEYYANRSRICPTITHLRLVGYADYGASTLNISCFPQLSHLAIPFHGLDGQSFPVLETWALEVPTLQVLVILVYEDLIPADDATATPPQRQVVEDWVKAHKDHRVQVGIWPCQSTAVRADWEEVARGAPSIWERAME